MEWEVIEGKLTREFEFSSFTQAIEFVNKITEVAQKDNHHPDILIHSYRKVKIMLFSHDENKISEKDYEMSREIDGLLDD